MARFGPYIAPPVHTTTSVAVRLLFCDGENDACATNHSWAYACVAVQLCWDAWVPGSSGEVEENGSVGRPMFLTDSINGMHGRKKI
jgi:hypothetical protein